MEWKRPDCTTGKIPARRSFFQDLSPGLALGFWKKGNRAAEQFSRNLVAVPAQIVYDFPRLKSDAGISLSLVQASGLSRVT
jgi:hypothetical protein